jgi:hypothetical protein
MVKRFSCFFYTVYQARSSTHRSWLYDVYFLVFTLVETQLRRKREEEEEEERGRN